MGERCVFGNGLLPDFDSPMAPPAVSVMVRCLHCGKVYASSLMKWDGNIGEWVCVDAPRCDGVGYGYDVLPLDAFVRSSVA